MRSWCFGATVLVVASSVQAAPKVLHAWSFGGPVGWNGWTPGEALKDVQMTDAGARFRAVGSDPILVGPRFAPIVATNQQWVEIELDADGPGVGELFYTNKTEGRYSGFESHWRSEIRVPDKGLQTVVVWPFWGALKKIDRLRFDPPGGVVTLRSIRIMDGGEGVAEPTWDFTKGRGSWVSLHAARMKPEREWLQLEAETGDAVIFTPVKPFSAAERSILDLKFAPATLEYITLAWSSSEHAGLAGEPITLNGPLRDPMPLDLRVFPTWKGTITGLAIGFGAQKGDSFQIKSLSIGANDPKKPLIRLKEAKFDRPLVRAGEKTECLATFEHVAGPPTPLSYVRVLFDFPSGKQLTDQQLPPLSAGKSYTMTIKLVPPGAGRGIMGAVTKTFAMRPAPLYVEPKLWTRPKVEDYAVPPPTPVESKYDIGVYYFPGWSPTDDGTGQRWKLQEPFPERDPLLGFYREGNPEVADWHIKWAVENGIRFFLYDWYWRDGREVLREGLNEGFLKARYRNLMKFAIMWANHAPFSSHTPEQLLGVTDYWIEHYFRQPNYYLLDGKPYVSFFAVGELISNLGGEAKVKAALQAMRDRAKAAGLPGLHIAACAGADRAGIESVAACGFDSFTAYNYAGAGSFLPQSPYRAFILGHEQIWEGVQGFGVLPYVPLLTTNWDARPWHGPTTMRRYRRNTADFTDGLRRLKKFMDAHQMKVGLLEAWNEWGEGSYMEPNREFGFGDVEAVRKVFALPGSFPPNIWPGDVGTAGKYDIRPATQPTTRP